MFEKVKEQTYVTFVGVPGSGKTATARHIALKLQEEGYDILPITDKNKIEDYCDPQNLQVFLIDDVVGIFGLDMAEVNILFKYQNRFTEPTMPNIKILMTCREAVFRNKTVKNCFLSKKENVVHLHNDENALTYEDKHNLLLKYDLESNLLSQNSMTPASKMFPFLCKIFSKKKEFKKHGKDFFIAPVPCLLERLEEMNCLNKLQYACLTLLMINQNKLSEEDLEKENNFEKKSVLRKCEVNSTIDSFELANSLSEMEGTYTQKCGNIFSFVHDSMFTIMAYHFGCKFPEMILQYMSSNYIAHYIKLATYQSQESESDEEESSYEFRTEENETREEFCTFEHSRVQKLCIPLSDKHYPMFAGRLLKDVKNGFFFNVFMNEALRDKKLLTAFIEAMKNKTYEELYSLFLSEFKDSSQEINYYYQVKKDSPCQHLNTHIGDQFCCSKFFFVRAISWVIFYGHHQILEFIIERILKEKGNLTDLFQNDQRKDKRCFPDLSEEDSDNENESMLDNVFSSCKSKNDSKNNSDVSKEIESYCEPASIEQYRLLCFACFAGYIKIVKILLKYISRDIFMKTFKLQGNAQSKNKPFVIACKFGYADIVMEFLKAGAKVNFHDDFQTPLTTACKNGHLGVVELLIKAGADVNLKVEDQSLQQADCGDNELIKRGADVNLMPENKAAIKNTGIDAHICEANKMTKSVSYFSHQNVNKTPLIIACEEDNLNLVKMLIKAKASVNLDDGENTPLTIACKQGQLEFVKELIKAGADINLKDKSRTPLTTACYYGRIYIVESLIEAGADVNANDGNMSPLTAACIDGELKVVEKLIKAGAIINLIGGDKTPLTAACAVGDLNIVNTFLKEGADVNLSDGKQTPLTAVCEDGDLSIVKALITAGADVNLHDGTRTPLAAAHKWARKHIIQELIKAGADVNQDDVPTHYLNMLMRAIEN